MVKFIKATLVRKRLTFSFSNWTQPSSRVPVSVSTCEFSMSVISYVRLSHFGVRIQLNLVLLSLCHAGLSPACGQENGHHLASAPCPAFTVVAATDVPAQPSLGVLAPDLPAFQQQSLCPLMPGLNLRPLFVPWPPTLSFSISGSPTCFLHTWLRLWVVATLEGDYCDDKRSSYFIFI